MFQGAGHPSHSQAHSLLFSKDSVETSRETAIRCDLHSNFLLSPRSITQVEPYLRYSATNKSVFVTISSFKDDSVIRGRFGASQFRQLCFFPISSRVFVGLFQATNSKSASHLVLSTLRCFSNSQPVSPTSSLSASSFLAHHFLSAKRCYLLDLFIVHYLDKVKSIWEEGFTIARCSLPLCFAVLMQLIYNKVSVIKEVSSFFSTPSCHQELIHSNYAAFHDAS